MSRRWANMEFQLMVQLSTVFQLGINNKQADNKVVVNRSVVEETTILESEGGMSLGMCIDSFSLAWFVFIRSLKIII